jgi:hypothetical protein
VHKVRDCYDDEGLSPDRDTEVRLTLIQANEDRFCNELLTRLLLDIGTRDVSEPINSNLKALAAGNDSYAFRGRAAGMDRHSLFGQKLVACFNPSRPADRAAPSGSMVWLAGMSYAAQ